MPQHEYYEYFGPDYTLHVAPSNMENKNSRTILDDIRAKLLDNLSKLQHAPSVPFQERPPHTELPEADEDQYDENERWDAETDMDVDERRMPLYGRVKRELLEPDHKDVANDRGGVDMDATFTEAAVSKVTKPNSALMDEPNGSEQGNSNKPSAEHANMIL